MPAIAHLCRLHRAAWMRPPIAPVLIACSLLHPPVHAGPAATSRIEQVIVYPGLAEVQRSARVAAGARELVLACLSADFDVSSLRVEGSEGLRIGPVSAHTRARAEAPECSTHPLDARIRQLEERLAALQAESGGHALALGVLRQLVPVADAPIAPSPAPPRTAAPGLALNATQLQSLLHTVRSQGQQAMAEQARLAREQDAVQRELAPLRAERDRALPRQGHVRELRLALVAAREGSVRLSYQVAGPTWAPAYRATLDADANTVTLDRLAQVSQRTGEDWSGVTMRLSTGTPRGATAGPLPQPWSLAVRAPMAEGLLRRKADSVAAMALGAAPMPAPAPVAADSAPENIDFAITPVESAFATEFVVPGSVDVAGGGTRVALELGSVRLPAELKLRSTPQADASAWLVAELARPEGVWPAGALQLLRGTQVVGQTSWQPEARERITLPFGRDELVAVRVQPLQPHQSSAGFIGNRSEQRITHAYTVESRRRGPITLELLEASPVSTDEQISVARRFVPQVQAGDWQDLPGVVRWVQTLTPGQPLRLEAEYVIGHAKGLAVTGLR